MQGTYIIGKLKGYSETEWSSKGKSGKNYRVGIVVRTYKDQFGEDQESVQLVDISAESATRIAVACESLKGKTVQIPVVFKARVGGRDGAWLSCFMPKDGEIKALKPVAAQAA